VKYAVIFDNMDFFPIRMMCRLLKVSKSGYYDWVCREPSKQAKANQELAQAIKKEFEEHKSRYGSIRIARSLRAKGIIAGRHRIRKVMKAQGLCAKATKKYRATSKNPVSANVAPNLLQQDFSSSQINKIWVSDITYLWTTDGWFYLAVVLDVFSRRVIGWKLSKRMTADIVVDALEMSIGARGEPKNVIVHSDQGTQYCSKVYQDLLQKHQLIGSMSKRGDCYDNAAMESWNHSLKVEAIHGEKLLSQEEMKFHIFEYIELYYNRVRFHSTLGYLSPNEFESIHTKVA
jgi:transposase InsO family protein